MTPPDQSEYSCTNCNSTVTQQDTFCPHCGSLFDENRVCANHPSIKAAGVCVICGMPCCKKCGSESNRVFLCDAHWHYEIQEGMARVYGSIDNVQAQYVTQCLEQASLHPFQYSRMFNPGAGAIDNWVRAGIRNFGNHPIVEQKVLVPFSEVIKAENTLRELDIRDE
jgi:hypothetical protein